MTDLNEKDKAQVRSWLFEILSRIEIADAIQGAKYEQGNEVTIKITFIDSLVTSRKI